MKKIVFVTGNKYKLEIARNVLEGSEISLTQKNLETPEIQGTDICEIASYSAKWAAEKLRQPVAVTDAGYYIKALNGFPGPFIKYTNQWFSAEDYLKLMEEKKGRTVVIKGCLSYCEPGKEPVTFESLTNAKIAERKGPKGETPINEIFIPEGFNKTESAMPRKEMVNFWAKVEKYWLKLAEYLNKEE